MPVFADGAHKWDQLYDTQIGALELQINIVIKMSSSFYQISTLPNSQK